MTRQRRILGIDPGFAKAGWGVIDTSGPQLRALGFGVVTTRTAMPHAERLLTLFRTLTEVIEEYHPDQVAVEEVFQGKSPRSALLLGEGRGVCVLAGAHCGVPVCEYPASVIKLALTGNGRAAKPQIQAMVCRLLGLAEIPRPHDAADALGVAITHFQRGTHSLSRRLEIPKTAVARRAANR